MSAFQIQTRASDSFNAVLYYIFGGVISCWLKEKLIWRRLISSIAHSEAFFCGELLNDPQNISTTLYVLLTTNYITSEKKGGLGLYKLYWLAGIFHLPPPTLILAISAALNKAPPAEPNCPALLVSGTRTLWALSLSSLFLHYKELRNKHPDDSAVYYQRSETGKVRWAGERLSLLTRKLGSSYRKKVEKKYPC